MFCSFRVILAIAFLAFSASFYMEPAFAEQTKNKYYFYRTGNKFYEECQQVTSIAYLVGLLDGIKLQEQMGGKKLICTSADVTAGQLKDVVCRYLADNPAKRHAPAPYIAASVLGETFPCDGQ